ncbi:hypothetical protein Skr01_44760 [Sphaerisporangium krabiense]|nr:hypothetical protein Skr01_44760 [Sphaerisporangium krabiense]
MDADKAGAALADDAGLVGVVPATGEPPSQAARTREPIRNDTRQAEIPVIPRTINLSPTTIVPSIQPQIVSSPHEDTYVADNGGCVMRAVGYSGSRRVHPSGMATAATSPDPVRQPEIAICG